MASKLMNVALLNNFLKNKTSFDRTLNKVNIVSVGNGKCVAELKVEEEHANILGGLHGGLSATLVDVISTYALHSDRTDLLSSVSVDLHLSYCKGARINDEIVVDANLVRCGKTLAFLDVLIKDKASGNVLVKGSHTKFCLYPTVGDSKSDKN